MPYKPTVTNYDDIDWEEYAREHPDVYDALVKAVDDLVAEGGSGDPRQDAAAQKAARGIRDNEQPKKRWFQR